MLDSRLVLLPLSPWERGSGGEVCGVVSTVGGNACGCPPFECFRVPFVSSCEAFQGMLGQEIWERGDFDFDFRF